ncbi:MAG: Two component multi-sensor signal transduction histidine kinase [Blastococcus sp.]|nr:Two component multi-sensor signal transduction histidine kinase [Blastococcus sp.]
MPPDSDAVSETASADDAAEAVARIQLQTVLDTSGEAFVGMAADETVVGWNAAAQDLLGWTTAEVTGRPLVDTIFPPQHRDSYARGLRELRAAGEAGLPLGPVEITAMHRDGREICVEARVGRVRSGSEWRYYAFLHDISERLAAEHSLARAEERYRLFAENSGNLITRHAPDGRFLYVSEASYKLLGFTPEELIDQDPWAIVHPDDAAQFGDHDPATLATHATRELTFRMRHRDGHWVWIEAVSSVLRDEAGHLEEIQVSSRNVTDRRAREARSQEESKLESLGRLSAGLAHEINSPIQFVGDNARFLAEAYRELIRIVLFYRGLLDSTDPLGWEERRAQMRDAEEGIEFDYLQTEIPSAVEQTLHGIQRVSTIVRAMKTFSHPGHKEQVPADLNEAIEATVTVTRHQVNSVADLRLQLAELPPVRCNIADLNQVFLNLIVNAADAIADTGEPGIIDVTTALDGDHVVIAISDTGGGIPDDVRSKIFDPFFTTKDVGKGSGQGLPLVHAVIHEGHGGTLTVDSTVGSGSTFTIRLPVDGKA